MFSRLALNDIWLVTNESKHVSAIAALHFGVFQKKKLFDVRSAGFGDFFRFPQFCHQLPFKKANLPKTEKVVRQPTTAVKIKKVHTQKLSPMTLFSVKEKKMITTMFFFLF